MRRNREREEYGETVVVQQRLTFRQTVERTILLMISVIMFFGGIVILVEMYFGETGVRTMMVALAIIAVVGVVWLIILLTLGISNQSTQKTVTRVAESIAMSEEAKNRADMMQIMAMFSRMQQSNRMLEQTYYPYGNNQYPVAPYQQQPQTSTHSDRFDYHNHFDDDDYDTGQTGLR